MTDQPVIRLHNSRETEFEFDVAIQGPSEESKPVVRFVLENVKGYNVAIDCESSGSNKWAVKIPALNQLSENHNFHVEVIVDGYFFVPTAGLVEVTSPPQVAIKESFATKKIEKPMVSATFENVELVPAKKKLVEYQDLDLRDQIALHNQTVKTGAVLTKAGKIMENGFDTKQSKMLDSKSLSNLIRMIKESLDNINNKIML